MGFSLYLGPFQPFLEEKLFEALENFRATSPEAPLTVVVPNLMLARHLGVCAARRERGCFNVRFQTLRHFLRDSAEKAFVKEDLKTVPEALMVFLLQKTACRNAGARELFGPVLETPGFARALRETFGDLRQGRWNPRLLREAAASLRSSPDWENAAKKWSVFASVMEDFQKMKSARGWADENDAAERVLEGSLPPASRVWVYGFYDATALQRKVLLHLAGKEAGAIFVPFRDFPVYRYARSFVDHLKPFSGRIVVSEETHEAPSRLSCLRRGLFDAGFSPEKTVTGDESLAVELCAGESGEMRQAARVFARLGDGVPWGDCAVVLRAEEPYGRVLPVEFQSLGVSYEWKLHYSLLETPEGKAALSYLECFSLGFPRALLSQFLFSPCLRPAFFGLKEEDWDPPAWDALSLRAGVVEGLSQWKKRIGRLESKLISEGKGPDETAGNLLRVLSKLSRLEKEFQGTKSWADKAACLSGQMARVFTSSGPLNLLRSALEPVRALGSWKEEAAAADFARVAGEIWRAEKCAREDSTPGGVVIGDLMETRGVPFPNVVFPGLAEKVVPRPVRMDPLLPDAERQALNESKTPGKDPPHLALKGDGLHEERLLFALAAEGARERLVLTAPSSDALTGDARVVSSFLEEAVRAACGRIPESLPGAFPWIQAAPSSVSAPHSLKDCDRREEAFLFFLREMRRGDASYFLAAARRTPFFFEGTELLLKRQTARVFTAYDGMLTGAEALKALEEKHSLSKQVLSASQIESYAVCPTRYFFKYLLRLEVVPEPGVLLEMEGRDKGSLAHRILEAVFRRGLEEGWLQKRDKKAALECLALEAGAVFKAFEEKGWTGTPAMWEWNKSQMAADLKRVVLDTLEDSDWEPDAFEVDLGGEAGLAFPLEQKRELRLQGWVDRVDRSKDGRAYRVVDYKTGSDAEFRKRSRYYAGCKIQLPLYLWALQERYPGRQGLTGVYDFITKKGRYERYVFKSGEKGEDEKTLRAILGTVARGVADGRFPASAGACEHCDFKLLCGTGMVGRAERKRDDPEASSYYSLEAYP
jgi:RecB family exonuclease